MEYAVSTNTYGSNAPMPTLQDAKDDLLQSTAPGLVSDVLSFLIFTPENNQDPYRLFTTRYCGPGGAGTTTGVIDAACKAHDECYAAAGLSANSTTSGAILSLNQASAAQSCNQALYDAARMNNNTPGSKALQWWLTNGDTVKPFAGFNVLAPGTAVVPW